MTRLPAATALRVSTAAPLCAGQAPRLDRCGMAGPSVAGVDQAGEASMLGICGSL
ncbi:MAG: hypothetical protein AAF675_15965 [Pseudomonadota bacterium]